MILHGSVFLVVGISKSGVSASKFLKAHGGKVYIFDQFSGDNVLRAKEELKGIGCTDVAFDDLDGILKQTDAVVLSPGVAIDNSVPKRARQLGVRIIGEFELGSLFCKAPFIAVTGTNGKTTTCALIDAILKEAGINSEQVGNMGVPVTDKADSLSIDDVAVAEVSSFQLETVHSFTPHIACLLNVTEDHLNRHYNMENYIFLKKRIFKSMREGEYAVLNAECPVCLSAAEEIKAKTVWFSSLKEVDGGYVREGILFFRGEAVIPINKLALKGRHNIENALAAVCAAKLLKIENKHIEKALSEFKGVKHRIEFIREVGGKSFYNDSKGTNVDSTIRAVESMNRPTVVILGGSDKGYDYKSLFAAFKNSRIVHAVISGENRARLIAGASVSGFDNISVVPEFESAVRIAALMCPEGGNVLLSPASASFDRFSGYEERGDTFIGIVNALAEEALSERHVISGAEAVKDSEEGRGEEV